MTAWVHIDPKINYVPDSVINFATKRVLYMAFKSLISGEIFNTENMRKRILDKMAKATDIAK